MHQPRPHGTFGAATEEDAAAAELLARRLTNLKQQSGLDSLRLSRTLPSGALAIAQDMGGVFKVIIQPSEVPPVVTQADGLAKSFIPMLFSGAIDGGILRPGQGVTITLTEQARRRIVGYDPEKQLPAKQVALQRFVIEHHVMVSELMPQNPGDFIHTQYTNQRPTWYSGAMAEVMQIVGGYGRQVLAELPDTELERARMPITADLMRRIVAQLGNTRLPGYTGLPAGDGKYLYDYKFNKTNGVGFDRDRKPWLLQVNTRGVYAMPLPLIPATTTPAFREHVEEAGDEELLWILNRFGGMPSGETMPILVGDFEAWRRAGVIVRVCDVGDFYSHLFYASAIGWSFNARGDAGFNTCYDYDEDGVGEGYSYKLSLNLAAAPNAGKLPESFDLEDPQEGQALNRYLSMLYEQLDSTSARSRAIKYKLRRVPVADILARAENKGPNEVDYWDNLEVAPIAAHSGNVAQTAKGYLYSPGRFMYQPQIKFPEPFMQGCVSHDFGPMKRIPSGMIVRCDTTMFGYYVGDQLKVAKYFLDTREYTEDVQSDFEQCMAVGSWTQVVTTGSTTLMGHFYTSDIDEREAAPEQRTTTKIVGTDLGYESLPNFEFDFFFWRPGTLWRNRYFKHKTNTETTQGYSRSVALCVPFLSRNSILHALQTSMSGISTNESVSRGSVRDPWSYRYFTHHFVWAWNGGVSGSQAAVPVYPKDGNPVWVVQENYEPSVCSDFADQGAWIPGLPANYTWLIHPKSNAWLHSGGGGAPSIVAYSKGEQKPATNASKLQLSIFDQPGEVAKELSNMYFLGSPDDFVGVFYRDIACVVAGETVYANVSEADPEAPTRRKRFGACSLVDHSTASHFIGVINE